MKQKKVVVLGATGAVGQEMLKVLEERKFPVSELVALGSVRSAGRKLMFRGEEIEVREGDKNSFSGADIVLGAVENAHAKVFAPYIREAGAVFVDNSSAFRMDKDVPLVVPEVNPEDVKLHKGIISNPNCSTTIALVAVNAINRLSPIKSMVASTYQAVSGAGAGGTKELENQMHQWAEGKALENTVFPYQIAFNLIPQIGGFDENGYTSEEMKMQNEGRKIMHLPELKVTCTCVRVPVWRSHSISISLITEERLDIARVRTAIEHAQGCRLEDDQVGKRYPMPLETSDQDLVFVGRIRRDLINANGIALWCCGDQVRKGAATNAIQIAELL